MTVDETREWIQNVNNGTESVNRPSELRENSQPCSKDDTFTLTVEQVGPNEQGYVKVGTADERGVDTGKDQVIIPAQSHNVREGVNDDKSID